MPAFSVFFVACAVVVFAVLHTKRQSAAGVARAQLGLYSLGLLLFCIGAITTNLVLPYVLSDSRYSILGPWFVLLFLSFVAHGIVRYRFMNLRLVVQNWLTAALAAAIALLPLILTVIGVRLAPSRSRATPLAVDDVVLLVAGATAIPAWLAVRRLLHRYVYRGDGDFQSLVSTASSRLAHMLPPEEVARVVADTIVAAVRPDSISVYGRATGTDEFRSLDLLVAIGRGQPAKSLPESITSEIRRRSVLVSRTHVAVEIRPPLLSDKDGALKEHRWSLAFPLILDSELIGAVVIGEKLSGAPYYREDIGLLRVLIRQAAIALKNGELYRDVLLANQYIENIVATISSGIVVLYNSDNLRVLNHAAVNLLGLSSPAPTTIPIHSVPREFAFALRDSLASGERAFEVTLKRDGTSLPLMCMTSALRDPKGETFGAVVAITDVSLVNALELERGRAERLAYYETLAATLAHEIANPLVPIKTMTQLLLRRKPDADFVAQCAGTMAREVDRIERLVNRLRALSHPANHEKRQVRILTVVEEAIAVIAPSLVERGIETRLQAPGQELMILGDEDDLHELFLNLLINAAEASDPGAVIEVTVSREGSTVRVAIVDHGSGIPDELISKLFEPLVSSKERGSGLGLTVCQGVAVRHGGKIEARNHSDGAVFVVELPLEANQEVTTK
jgi:signal transduction histidine kinase